jgi:hypothetical protein
VNLPNILDILGAYVNGKPIAGRSVYGDTLPIIRTYNSIRRMLCRIVAGANATNADAFDLGRLARPANGSRARPARPPEMVNDQFLDAA